MTKKDGGVVQMWHEILAKKIVGGIRSPVKNEEQVLPFPKPKGSLLAVHSLSLTFQGNGSRAVKGAESNHILAACMERGICPAEGTEMLVSGAGVRRRGTPGRRI